MLIYIYSASLIVTFACFNCLLINILYVTIRLMNTIHAIIQLSLNVHRIRFRPTQSIWVWLSGLRLYLQSDRDKTLHMSRPSVVCCCTLGRDLNFSTMFLHRLLAQELEQFVLKFWPKIKGVYKGSCKLNTRGYEKWTFFDQYLALFRKCTIRP